MLPPVGVLGLRDFFLESIEYNYIRIERSRELTQTVARRTLKSDFLGSTQTWGSILLLDYFVF